MMPQVTIVLGLLSGLLWGVPDVPLAVAVRRVGELPVLVWSLLIGTLAATPFVLATGAPHATTRGLWLAALAGAITVVAYLTIFKGLQTCPVSIAAPVLSCEGAVAAVITVVAGERISLTLGLLLAAAVAGVVVVAAGGGAGAGGEAARAQLRGVAWVVVSSLVWGVVLAIGPPVFHELGTWWGFLLVRTFTLVFALAVALVAGRGRSLAPALRIEPWRIAMWGLCDAGAYLSYYLAADRGPISVASVLAAQFATFGAISGVVLLHERLHARQWFGVAVVVAAVAGISAIT